MKRRHFLQSSLFASTTLFFSRAFAAVNEAFVPSRDHDYPKVPNLGLSFSSPDTEAFVDALPVPPMIKPGGKLDIAETSHQFHRDLPAAPSWGYGGVSHLGPTFESVVGEDVTTTFVNRLQKHILADDIDVHVHGASVEDRTAPPVSVHLHGAPNAPVDDGHPLDLFRPGKQKAYRFANTHEASHLWYHDHAMGNLDFLFMQGSQVNTLYEMPLIQEKKITRLSYLRENMKFHLLLMARY